MTRRCPRSTRLATLGAFALVLGVSAARGEGLAPLDQEVVPPSEAEAIAGVVAMIEAGVNALAERGQRPVLRDAHAKTHGCVAAEFTTEANLPDALKRGVFAEGRPYPAWIRFSNASGTPKPDGVGDGRGMAIKLVGVPGRKILADEADAITQDFVLIDFPRFFLRNALEYGPFVKATLGGAAGSVLRDAPRSGDAQRRARREDGRSSVHQTLLQHDSVPARRALRQARRAPGRVRSDQCAGGAAPESNPNDLRAGMAAWLGARDACFRFTVQPQMDATMPVEDPTVLWDEARSAPIDVATIRISKQVFDRPAQLAACENLSFTPWHSLPEHRPVGGINRVRKAAYLAVSKLRHQLNGVPRAEPTTVETVR